MTIESAVHSHIDGNSSGSSSPDEVVKTEVDNANGLVRQRSHSLSTHHHHHHHQQPPIRGKRQSVISFVSNKYVDQIVLHLIFAFFGITGVLARAGLERLTAFHGSQYGGVLWSNFTGCLIMGILVKSEDFFADLIVEEVNVGQVVNAIGHGDIHNRQHRQLFHRAFKSKAEIPLYIGLATGCCGSITSFSSFMIELFELTALQPYTGTSFPNPGYGVMVFISYSIVTVAVSFSGFYLGHHIIDGVEKSASISFAQYTLLVELIIAILGLVGWIIVLVLSITEPNWRYWTFSCLFGPFGVYARFRLGKLLNKTSNRFMVGTFVTNMIATIIISILVVLQHGKKNNSDSLLISSFLDCQVITALEDGFCGNFSTISTFIVELSNFSRKRYAYIYGGASIALGFSIVILILGSYSWTVGLSELAAC